MTFYHQPKTHWQSERLQTVQMDRISGLVSEKATPAQIGLLLHNLTSFYFLKSEFLVVIIIMVKADPNFNAGTV